MPPFLLALLVCSILCPAIADAAEPDEDVSCHQVTMGLTLGSLDSVQLTVMGRYLSKQFADDLNQQAIADFVVVDASLQKNLGKHWRLALNAENLTDRSYIATQTGPVKTLGAPLLIMGGLRFEY